MASKFGRAFALLAAASLSCGGSDDEPAPAPTRPGPPARPAPVADATTSAGARPGGPIRPSASPAPTGYHLDPDQVEYVPSRRRRENETGKELELVLRSSPPGATAAVDGAIVGPTPAYWRGEATGKPREFTFVLNGYAMARYRFVPLRGGVVHATLERVMTEPR